MALRYKEIIPKCGAQLYLNAPKSRLERCLFPRTPHAPAPPNHRSTGVLGEDGTKCSPQGEMSGSERVNAERRTTESRPRS